MFVNLDFSLIPYLLAATAILACINIFLISRLNDASVFHRFLILFNAYLLVHVLYVMINDTLVHDAYLSSCEAPFALVYAPMLYFAGVTMTETRVNKQDVFFHSLPFLAFFLVFLWLSLFNHSGDLSSRYNKVLDFYMTLSNFFYIFPVISLSVKPLNVHAKARKLLLTGGIMLLIFITIIQFSIAVSDQYWLNDRVAVNLLRLLVFAALFVCVVFIFRYLVADVFYRLYLYEFTKSGKGDKPESRLPGRLITKYEKSLLSEKQLDEYVEKLERSMFLKKIYLDTDLSLQKLADVLRIPSHHLTQVLNLRMEQSFYDYVNGYRIRHACTLLRGEGQVNLEELALMSGFNSKVSFNRNFKNKMGCTPSAYREKMQG